MLIIYLPIILYIHYFTIIFIFFFLFLSLLLVILLLLLFIMMVKRESILVMNYEVTGEFITCKEFGLLISESLEWSLYIFLYPVSNPFILHLFYAPHFAQFFDSVLKVHPQCIYFLSSSPLPCAKLLFSAMATCQWLPTYLSLMVTFAYSQFLPWREIMIILSK